MTCCLQNYIVVTHKFLSFSLVGGTIVYTWAKKYYYLPVWNEEDLK